MVIASAFQDAVRSEVVALVERVLDRRPARSLSDHDVVNDVGIEVILLAETFDSVERPSSHESAESRNASGGPSTGVPVSNP